LQAWVVKGKIRDIAGMGINRNRDGDYLLKRDTLN
jgi:hypothetical protein